jgi:hypothetical protein
MTYMVTKPAFARSLAFAILLSAIGVRGQTPENVRLNQNAFALAARLIKEGHVIADGKGAWANDRPSTQVENEFIRQHGFGEYAKWHLGIDDRYAENTKRRYKFPYGDFKDVHRCALLAVKARARQYGHAEIENAAAELERAIEKRSTKNPPALGYGVAGAK